MVPTNPAHTPIQRFRLDADVWDELEVVAEAHGLDRSKLLGEFARWITRRGNVRSAPERPKLADLEQARVAVEKRRRGRELRALELHGDGISVSTRGRDGKVETTEGS